MSALADQLIKNNLAMPKADSPLFMAALDFFKKGGGRARAHDILDRAYARSGRDDDAEATCPVSERTRTDMPSASSPQANGSGLTTDAHLRHLTVASPVRPPLNLASSGVLGWKNAAAQSVFDRIKTNDGRAWGDVAAHELDSMGRDGALASRLREHLGVLSNTQYSKKIRDLINPETFEWIRKQAHGS